MSIIIENCDQPQADTLTNVMGDLTVRNNNNCSIIFHRLKYISGTLYVVNNANLNPNLHQQLLFPKLAQVDGDVIVGNYDNSEGNTAVDGAKQTIRFHCLAKIGRDLRIGSIGQVSNFGNGAITGSDQKIEFNCLRQVVGNIDIGSFEGGVNGNCVGGGSDNCQTLLVTGLCQVGGHVRIGAFDANSDIGNCSTGIGNNQSVHISGHAIVTGNLEIGAFSSGTNGNGIYYGSASEQTVELEGIVEVRGTVRIGAHDNANHGNGTSLSETIRTGNDENCQRILLCKLAKICGDLKIGISDGSTLGNIIQYGIRQQQSIVLNSLRRVGGDIVIGSTSALQFGNILFQCNKSKQVIDLDGAGIKCGGKVTIGVISSNLTQTYSNSVLNGSDMSQNITVRLEESKEIQVGAYNGQYGNVMFGSSDSQQTIQILHSRSCDAKTKACIPNVSYDLLVGASGSNSVRGNFCSDGARQRQTIYVEAQTVNNLSIGLFDNANIGNQIRNSDSDIQSFHISVTHILGKMEIGSMRSTNFSGNSLTNNTYSEQIIKITDLRLLVGDLIVGAYGSASGNRINSCFRSELTIQIDGCHAADSVYIGAVDGQNGNQIINDATDCRQSILLDGLVSVNKNVSIGSFGNNSEFGNEVVFDHHNRQMIKFGKLTHVRGDLSIGCGGTAANGNVVIGNDNSQQILFPELTAVGGRTLIGADGGNLGTATIGNAAYFGNRNTQKIQFCKLERSGQLDIGAFGSLTSSGNLAGGVTGAGPGPNDSNKQCISLPQLKETDSVRIGGFGIPVGTYGNYAGVLGSNNTLTIDANCLRVVKNNVEIIKNAALLTEDNRLSILLERLKFVGGEVLVADNTEIPGNKLCILLHADAGRVM